MKCSYGDCDRDADSSATLPEQPEVEVPVCDKHYWVVKGDEEPGTLSDDMEVAYIEENRDDLEVLAEKDYPISPVIKGLLD